MCNFRVDYQIKRDQSREPSAEDKQLNCSASEALNTESWNPVLIISDKESCLNGKFFNRERMELCSIPVLQKEIRNV